MSSTRLPGKVLLPLGGRAVLAHVVRRAAVFSRQVVVCTSLDESDSAIAEFCGAHDILCVRGSLDDVFDRFRTTLGDSRLEATPFFARVTGDCPLLSPTLAKRAISALDHGIDYVSLRAEQLPRGLALELVRRTTFLNIDPTSLDQAGKEHVTLHLYENPKRYKCIRIEPPEEYRQGHLRLTLDYPEDYELLGRLFRQGDDLTAREAIEMLGRSPELLRLNAHCEQKAVR
jgi:spore coat polysaccharide biosynthesis protein SpsF